MQGLSDDIVERTRTREVTGVFYSRTALIAAAEELLLSGIDRADLDVSASFDELERRLNYASIPAADLADIPTAARRPFLGNDDELVTKAVAGSVAGCAAAVAVALLLVTENINSLLVVIVAVLCGLVAGGAAILVVHRRLQRERVRGLERLAEANGLLIWVRVRSPEKEAQAQEVLMRHGGEAVHVHEIELARRAEDLPFHSLRPDPWLGDERLGQP
jgi:hypothetical protein